LERRRDADYGGAVTAACNRREICDKSMGNSPLDARIGTVDSTASQTTYRLNLLGGFALSRRDGAVAGLSTRKAQFLLAYLAMPAGTPHARAKLAALLWGDSGEEQARGSLRNALAAIRAVLGPDALRSDRDTIAIAPDMIEVDLDLLARAADGSLDIADANLAHMIRSELLEGQQAPTSELEDWLTFERARAQRLAFAAGGRSITRHEERSDLAAAIGMAELLLTLDPLREKTHRLLIRLLMAAGEGSRAMAQIEACKAVLRRELGIAPSAETLALADGLFRGGRTIAAASPPSNDPAGTEPPTAFSIVVLPFANISGDPEQRPIAEGFQEDLITELSRLRDFSVISRQSSALFSSRPESATAAATELSVRYALNGSIRRAAGRIRVNVQLIDAQGNRCIWAERYDRDMADIFSVQDDIVANIIGSVDSEVRHDERDRAMRKPPSALDAWEMFHRGLSLIYRFTREANAEGDSWFRKAMDRAPDFALPYAGLAYSHLVKVMWYFTPESSKTVAEGVGLARLALARDPTSAFAQVALGRLQIFAGDLQGAIHSLRSAIATNPNFAQAHYGLAQALVFAGQPIDALGEIDIATKLSPKDPLASLFLTLKSFCHFSLGEFAEAESAARTATQMQSRETWSRLALAAALVQLDRRQEAEGLVREARRIEPSLTLASFGDLIRHGSPETKERIISSLSAAGIS
jgi:TolB-like protein/DNA-binding SARP family transcriptional activator